MAINDLINSLVQQNQNGELNNLPLIQIRGDNAPNVIDKKFIPATNEQINSAEDYQKNMNYNVQPLSQQNPIQNTGNGINAFLKGFNDNYNTGFAEGDIAKQLNGNFSDDGTTLKSGVQDKSPMVRLGEAFGTTSRLLKNPLVQGGIAALAYGAASGDPLYGLGRGVQWAGNRYNSNMYADRMKQEGYHFNPGIFGNIDEKDYNAITGADYKRYANLIRLMGANTNQYKADTDREYKQNMIPIQQQRADDYGRAVDNSYSLGQQRNKIAQQNANTNRYKASKAQSVSSKKSTASKSGSATTQTQTSQLTVRVKDPSGKVGRIPVNQLQAALKMGYKKI